MDVIHESPPHKTTYVTISKDEYESMKTTLAVLEDDELMEQIRESKKAIKEGKTKSLEQFMKEQGVI